MCDVPANNRKTTEISYEQIEFFLREAAKKGVICCILGSGSEITLHPQWRDILKLATCLFPDTILFTNGSTLTQKDLDLFVKSGLTRLFVSLDASTTETFKIIRGFEFLEAIEEKINQLITLRSSRNSNTPLIRVSFVIQKENQHEAESFLAKWINKVDSVEFQDCSDIIQFRDRDYVDSLPLLKDLKIPGAPICHRPFSYMSLWASGRLSPCCTSYGRDSSELELANINELDFLNTALTKRRKLQQAFEKQDWNSIPNSCRHCLKNGLKI
jgi:hypothetical protein